MNEVESGMDMPTSDKDAQITSDAPSDGQEKNARTATRRLPLSSVSLQLPLLALSASIDARGYIEGVASTSPCTKHGSGRKRRRRITPQRQLQRYRR